jgi:hypothetical protein
MDKHFTKTGTDTPVLAGTGFAELPEGCGHLVDTSGPRGARRRNRSKRTKSAANAVSNAAADSAGYVQATIAPAASNAIAAALFNGPGGPLVSTRWPQPPGSSAKPVLASSGVSVPVFVKCLSIYIPFTYNYITP